MEGNARVIDSLFVKAVDYGKTTLELTKLKALDKSSEVVSTFLPHSIFVVLIYLFMLFAGIGLAIWIGGILGKYYLGFFIAAGFFLVIGVVIHFIFRKWLKAMIRNYFIRTMLK